MIMARKRKEKGKEAKRYRAIAREAKEGKDLGQLLKRARGLRDPYFKALALFDLSSDRRMGSKEAAEGAEEALSAADDVDRLWRRGELLAMLVKKIGNWGDEASRDRILDDIAKAISTMPEGQGLSDAIVGCAPRIGCGRLKTLLVKAISNKGFEQKDTKAVVRQWAQNCEERGLSVEDILEAIRSIPDVVSRSKLLGYLHTQGRKWKRDLGKARPLDAAVKAARSASTDEKLEALRYLAGQSTTQEELEMIATSMDDIDDDAVRARLLSTLGGSADKAGLKELALKWFKEGLETSGKIQDAFQRANIRTNLAKGLGRLGETGLSNRTFQESIEDCGQDEKIMKRICKAMEEVGVEPPVRMERGDKVRSVKAKKVGPKNVLALYDTYEGGLKPVHIRAVARAGPLCHAFDLDLALMGFPTEDLEGLIDQVLKDSNIGHAGRFLREMAEADRIMLVPCTEKEPPKDLDGIGLVVATTSRPKKEKMIGMREAIELARAEHPKGTICLIMGLGKRGLPSSLLKSAQYHLELTGSNVPLETSTAMGVIAEQLRAAQSK
jgi:tetratricopeptide (TPR) repeat protein